jgi:hypothetical protein
LTFILVLPISTTHAALPYLGSVTPKYSSFWSDYYGRTMYSTFHELKSGTGLHFKICSTNSSVSTHKYYVYEYDPGSGNDDFVTYSNTLDDNECKTFSIASYIDGDNNKAELYVVTNNSNTIIKFYD